MIVIKKSVDRQYHFTVHARNGKKIATSETYRSKAALKKGIAAMLNNVDGMKDTTGDFPEAGITRIRKK